MKGRHDLHNWNTPSPLLLAHHRCSGAFLSHFTICSSTPLCFVLSHIPPVSSYLTLSHHRASVMCLIYSVLVSSCPISARVLLFCLVVHPPTPPCSVPSHSMYPPVPSYTIPFRSSLSSIPHFCLVPSQYYKGILPKHVATHLISRLRSRPFCPLLSHFLIPSQHNEGIFSDHGAAHLISSVRT